VVRDGQDGATYRRREDEAPAAFYGRLRTGPPDDVSTSDGAGLQVLVHGSADVPDGAEVCALYPGPLDPARVRLVDAADLVTQLAPRG